MAIIGTPTHIGTTADEIKLELRKRRFPKILTDDDYEGIIQATLREFNRFNLVSKFVSFLTRADTTDYYIFDTGNAITAGVAAGATRLKNVVWDQEWELVGLCGNATSYLKIMPTPGTEYTISLELAMNSTLADINTAELDLFMQWAEYYTADTLANMYSVTAGTKLLNFGDSVSAMQYWERKAVRYYARAMATQAGIQGHGMRS